MALPADTPTPEAHSPVEGSFEYQGGAWVTPTRSFPRSLISSRDPAARTGVPPAINAEAIVAPVRVRTVRRFNFISWFPFSSSGAVFEALMSLHKNSLIVDCQQFTITHHCTGHPTATTDRAAAAGSTECTLFADQSCLSQSRGTSHRSLAQEYRSRTKRLPEITCHWREQNLQANCRSGNAASHALKHLRD